MQARIYQDVLKDHFEHEGNMAFLAGPRQSGKSTTAMHFKLKHTSYWNWDDRDDRILLRGSPQNFLEAVHIKDAKKTVLVLDELHKSRKWRVWLKGLYDKHHQDYQIIVTGSARLNIFHRGGDSLLGRYYLYRHHPLSLGELEKRPFEGQLFRKASSAHNRNLEHLMKFGGFPAPLLLGRETSHRKWLRMRKDLLLKEDLRDLSRVEDIAAIERLVFLLQGRVGSLLSYQSLANDLDVSVDSIRRWIVLLNSLYYSYTIPPYTKKVKRSLKKMPKLYLWDWSEVADEAARFENLIASHLLKSTHYWTDRGYGTFDLFYIRTKEKREVDFLITNEKGPFLLVECKLSETNLNRDMKYFMESLDADYSCQVVYNKKADGKSIQELRENETISAIDFCRSLI
jgi:uncharacterized protein